MGRVGVNDATNVLVDPAATVIDTGLTETLYEGALGVAFGLGNPPPPQPARQRLITQSARAIRLRHILTMSPRWEVALQQHSTFNSTTRPTKSLHGTYRRAHLIPSLHNGKPQDCQFGTLAILG